MRLLTLAAAALLSTAALSAQEARTSFGIGTTINSGFLLVPTEGDIVQTQAGFNNILLPLRGTNFTVEPELGLFRMTMTSESGAFSSSQTVSANRLGLGLLKHFEKRENLEPYLAPRVGAVFMSFENKPSSGTTFKSKQTNLYLTGGAGAQYFFSGHFTLGGEAQLTYTHFGNPTSSGGGTTSTKLSGSTISSVGILTIRWYF